MNGIQGQNGSCGFRWSSNICAIIKGWSAKDIDWHILVVGRQNRLCLSVFILFYVLSIWRNDQLGDISGGLRRRMKIRLRGIDFIRKQNRIAWQCRVSISHLQS